VNAGYCLPFKSAEMEKTLLNKILLTAGNNVRLFRNNVGMAWAGKTVNRDDKKRLLTLSNFRPFHAGLTKGSSDLIGWTSVEITPEMVGKKVAVFTAIEAKTGRTRTTEAQQNFLNAVRDSGGISGIARIPEDVGKIIEYWENESK